MGNVQNTVIGRNKAAAIRGISQLIVLDTVLETGTQAHGSVHAFALALMSYFNCLFAWLSGS